MLKVGEIYFEKYKVVGKLGAGGMGSVYLVENINVGNLWAIKEISLQAGSQGDLLAEPEILKKLNHPNLPRIIDVIRDPGTIYIIEDYFQGQDLKEVIKDRKLCTEENVVKWATQLAEILVYLHNLKPSPLIYRDLKPGNIIIDQHEDLKLVDFGIAREMSDGEKHAKYVSKGYAAPEQYEGRFDVRSDIYGFGATFYHVLTGTKFDIDHPVPVKDLDKKYSEGIDYILAKCLSRDPQNRYANASNLFSDLNLIHRFSQEYKKNRRNRRLAVLGVVTAILLGIGAIALGINQKNVKQEELYASKVQQGITLTSQGRYDQAEKAFNQALDYKNDQEVYYNLARLYLRQNQYNKTREFLAEQIEQGRLQPDAEVCYLLGTASFGLGDYKNAISYFEKAIESGPLGKENQLAMRDLAVSYGRNGDYQKAEDILEKLRQKGAADHVVSYILGEISLAQNDYETALASFSKAKAEDPKSITYYVSLARTHSLISYQSTAASDKEAHLKEAMAVLNQARAISQYDSQVLNDYGKCCFELAQLYQYSGSPSSTAMYREALASFTNLQDYGLGEDDINLNINIALINDKLGNYKEAENNFQKALWMDAGDSHANFVYGMFKLKHKEYKNAYKYLKATVDLNKNPEEVSVAKARISELKAKGWI